MGIYTLVRSSFFGRLVYHLLGKKFFTYKEEDPGYIIPEEYHSEKEIMVDWDGPEDPDNPQNWPKYEKYIVVIVVMFLIMTVYMGSSISAPGTEQLKEQLDIPIEQAVLPLSMFILGYGIGPLLLGSLSENAAIGRTNLYTISLFLFTVLQIPTSLVNDIASLSVLRFLAGVFSSPTLVMGPALMGDVIPGPYVPVGIVLFSTSTIIAPSLGPIVGAVLVVKRDWHWPFWFMCMLSGICFVTTFFFLPETSSNTILYRKAKRLRELTGNRNIQFSGEVENKGLNVYRIFKDLLWRPLEIMMFDPIVLALDLHIALGYGILNIWFEAFFMSFREVYGFGLITLSLTFLTMPIGCTVGGVIYLPYIRKTFTLRLLKGEPVSPETFVPFMLVGSIVLPIGVFLFGWSSTMNVHWIVPLIGAALCCTGAFLIFQNEFNYLAVSFPRYVASVFTGTTFLRSVIAAMLPLASSKMYNNTGTDKFPLGWGCSILGFIGVAMISFPIIFGRLGPKLRARSKYAGF